MRIAVIGAGIAGLLNTIALARAGLDVDLYEEHRRVGYPKHCTGIVSRRTVDLIGRPARESVIAWFDHVDLVSRKGAVRVATEAARLDRVLLEELLLDEAESAGARTVLGGRVTRIQPAGRGIRVVTGNVSKMYDYVVIAEGLWGSLRKQVGANIAPLTSLGINIEGDIQCGTGEPRIGVNQAGPGVWFAWAVTSPVSAVFGALGPRPGEVRSEAERLAYSAGCRASEIYGGRVIHGPPANPEIAIGRNYAIVGDAAALTKPLTGGGLFPNALLVAKLSEHLSRGLEVGEAYRTAYREVYRILKRQYRVARLLLPRGGMWRLVDVLIDSNIISINRKIDYDYYNNSIKKIIKNIGLVRTVEAAVRVSIREPGLAAGLLKVLILP